MADLGPNENLIDVPGSRAALATPALVLDLDRFETNLQTLARLFAESNLRMRPHSKSHKCIEIARRQIEAGAVGVCCATLHEAEIMVGGGIAGVLITSPVVGQAKINRLAALNQKAERLKVVVDNPLNGRDLGEAMARTDRRLDVLIDVDVGMHRTGVADIAAAVDLARRIENSPSLSYRGVQGYSGRVQHIEDFDARDKEYGGQMDFLASVVDDLVTSGLGPSIVSGGGTGTHDIDRARGLFTEHQTGSYAFMDVEYNAVELVKGANAGGLPFVTSLFMQCSVVSNNADGFVTIDGGFKCFATDGPKPAVFGTETGGGLGGAAYDRFGDEHGKIILPKGAAKPKLGDVITLITPHCDPTVNLHNYYHCVRGNRLVDIWKIDARGVL